MRTRILRNQEKTGEQKSRSSRSKRCKDLQLLKTKVVTLDTSKKISEGSARTKRSAGTKKKIRKRQQRNERNTTSKVKPTNKDITEAREAIRNLIVTLEGGIAMDSEPPSPPSPGRSGPKIDSGTDKTAETADDADGERIRERYALLQRREAKSALDAYELRLKEEMRRELDRKKIEDAAELQKERAEIANRFRADVAATKQFDEWVAEKINELKSVRQQAQMKLSELREYEKQCISACEERHRLSVESLEAKLHVSMNSKLQKRSDEIQRKLTIALAPSPW